MWSPVQPLFSVRSDDFRYYHNALLMALIPVLVLVLQETHTVYRIVELILADYYNWHICMRPGSGCNVFYAFILFTIGTYVCAASYIIQRCKNEVLSAHPFLFSDLL